MAPGILLVEGEQAARKRYAQALASRFDVESASTDEAALHTLIERHFVIVVVHATHPDLVELAWWIRRHRQATHLVLIGAGSELEAEAACMGATLFKEPLPAARLLKIAERLVDG